MAEIGNQEVSETIEASNRSAHGIVRAISLVGVASAVNIIVGLLRVKIIAVLLGPAGVGIFGLLNGIMNAAVSVVGLGLNFSGIKRLAAAEDDQTALSQIRWALTVGNLALGLLACPLIWLLRHEIALRAFEDERRATEIGLIGIAVTLSLLAGSQAAVLQGLRRVRIFAWHTVIGAVLATVIGVVAISYWKMDGLIAFVLMTPAANLAVAYYFVRRITNGIGPVDWSAMVPEWKTMLPIGIGFTTAATINAIGTVVVQSMTLGDGGAANVGQLQAVQALSLHYIGFLFVAMQADFYPLLTNMVGRPGEARLLVNQQAELGLLVVSPILIGVIATSQWLIPILYHSDFEIAANLMRWWVLADILVIPAWVVGYILITNDKVWWFCAIQLFANLIYLAVVYLAFDLGFGLHGVVAGKLIMTGTVFILNTWVASRIIGFGWSHPVFRQILLLTAIILPLNLAIGLHPLIGGLLGILIAITVGLFNLRKIAHNPTSNNKLVNAVRAFYRAIGWSLEPKT